MARLATFLCRRHLEKTRVVRVKSWVPAFTREGIEWPCLLVDRVATRETIWPVWRWPWNHPRRRIFP